MATPLFKPEFRDATRAQCKASIVIQGLSGKGKSGLALAIAQALTGGVWEKIFCTDTENKSLDLFEGIRLHNGDAVGRFKKFDLLQAHGYRPTHYLAIKEAARQQGAEVLIQDSISHAWIGKNGVLQLVSALEAANTKVNKFNAWGQPEITAEKDAIYELIRDPEIHMISTVRVKEKFTQAIEDGKSVIKSQGEQQQQMPDLKYEPDLVLDMVQAGNTEGRCPKAAVIKSRYSIFSEGETYEFTPDVINQLKVYLEEGVDPDILLQQQRQDFINEIKYILDHDTSKRTVWAIYKSDAGYADTTLEELPLNVLRKLLSQLLN